METNQYLFPLIVYPGRMFNWRPRETLIDFFAVSLVFVETACIAMDIAIFAFSYALLAFFGSGVLPSRHNDGQRSRVECGMVRERKLGVTAFRIQ